MNSMKPRITFDEARKIAERQALLELEPYKPSRTTDVLDPQRHLEAEHCWMFFRSPEIDVPEHDWFVRQAAYAVSKRGSFSMIHDYSYDPVQLMEYLGTLSNYFGSRQE